MEDFIKGVVSSLFSNGIYDLIKIFFGGILGWFGHKSYNKYIKIGEEVVVKNSFKSKKNKEVEVGDGSHIEDSFKDQK